MTLTLTPFIQLDGKAEEAIRFYEQALEAEVVFKQTFGDAPADPERPMPDSLKGRVAHSVLKVGDAELFVADSETESSERPGSLVCVCISTADVARSQRLFESLSRGGRVDMPLQPTYFSPGFGVVTDKFGVVFQIFTKRD
ncbi:VOC family protein [Paenibacillus flagellatus]|uniref:Glyoxalase/fosfomycin resistance/dioxygenase domain-containing protein n=1 Tax=Paenibacillus flagellatus TaxID=2211139 RepID=A0A2V5K863_9BACL|nr:VOC family protein [Paenibacillus flagellatus]PYI55685.1 hypothetical protein DLM86_08130 [Paenibacillus flagellatus]